MERGASVDLEYIECPQHYKSGSLKVVSWQFLQLVNTKIIFLQLSLKFYCWEHQRDLPNPTKSLAPPTIVIVTLYLADAGVNYQFLICL